MMPSLLSSWAIALILSALSGPAVGLRPAVNEIYKKNLYAAQKEAESKLQKKDLICYEDQVLIDFQDDPDDSVPFCSSYLGVSDLLSTSIVTAKTSESLSEYHDSI